jgi:hypothetical protein
MVALRKRVQVVHALAKASTDAQATFHDALEFTDKLVVTVNGLQVPGDRGGRLHQPGICLCVRGKVPLRSETAPYRVALRVVEHQPHGTHPHGSSGRRPVVGLDGTDLLKAQAHEHRAQVAVGLGDEVPPVPAFQ